MISLEELGHDVFSKSSDLPQLWYKQRSTKVTDQWFAKL